MNLIIIFLLFIFVIILITLHIKIVPQSRAFVIERLGAYKETWNAGINFLVPFIDKLAKKISLKEQVIDFKPQPVITKDNVTMQIDSVIYFQITDPKLYTYGVENPISAIENLTATTLRNIIGDMELDTTLTSRDTINFQMRKILDEATDPWGMKINRVELKNILPPREIQDAMEKQMKAEREKREAILRAEGQKEVTIKEAQGEAEAILSVQKAEAEAIKLLKEAGANKEVLMLKAMDTFSKVADGQATKIIIPSELQNLTTFSTLFGEFKEKNE